MTRGDKGEDRTDHSLRSAAPAMESAGGDAPGHWVPSRGSGEEQSKGPALSLPGCCTEWHIGAFKIH